MKRTSSLSGQLPTSLDDGSTLATLGISAQRRFCCKVAARSTLRQGLTLYGTYASIPAFDGIRSKRVRLSRVEETAKCDPNVVKSPPSK